MFEEDLSSWWGRMILFKRLSWLIGLVHSWWVEEPGQFMGKTSMDRFIFKLLVSHVQGQNN